MTVKEMVAKVAALKDEYTNSINPEIRNYEPLKQLLGYKKLEWKGEKGKTATQVTVEVPGLVDELLALAGKKK